MNLEERVSRLEGAFERQTLLLQTLFDRMASLENRMTMLFIGMIAMMGMMMAGFVTLFVAIMLRG